MNNCPIPTHGQLLAVIVIIGLLAWLLGYMTGRRMKEVEYKNDIKRALIRHRAFDQEWHADDV